MNAHDSNFAIDEMQRAILRKQRQDSRRSCLHWHCLVVSTGRDDEVADLLFHRHGLEARVAYGTVVKTVRSRGRARTIQVDRPAFPGYVFIGFDGHVNWLAIKAIEGILGVIATADSVPLRIGQGDIDEIHAREGRGEYDWDWRPPPPPKFDIVQNDRVRMKDGALAKYTGVVRRTPKSRTVEVVPDLFPDMVVLIDIGKLDPLA